MKTVGILGIQGDVAAHARAIGRVGAAARRVLRPEEVAACDALILPGGESTTISKGIERLELAEPLRAFARSGRPLLGTCAGAILMAREARASDAHESVETLGVLDAVAVRNAYGTQVDSFSGILDPGAAESIAEFRCVFIRAPQLEELGPAVEILARVDERPVLVRDANVWAATFHPELTDDPRLHAAFLSG
jgi:5'-phosphate synthase pdxT subunit